MSATVSEHEAFSDVGGKPLVNGKVFYGLANSDPVLNPVGIFSDRGFLTSIPNPQILDIFGRTESKVYISGRYSIKIENSLGAQILQNLDNGEDVQQSVVNLTNVVGIDTITADAIPTITAYVDKQQYTFTAVGTNTGTASLNIDNIGLLDIKSQGNPLMGGELSAGVIALVAFNAVTGEFDLLGGGDLIFAGIIVIWSGSIGTIPTGWGLCDGTAGTPDLTGDHTLSTAELAVHPHLYDKPSGSTPSEGDGVVDGFYSQSFTPTNTGNAGSGLPHKHANSLPPFYALAYIMRL